MADPIPLSRLKGIKCVYEDDLFELAKFIMKVQIARDTPTRKTRATVGLIVSHYAHMLLTTDIGMRQMVQAQGICLDSVVEPDDSARWPYHP